MDLGWNRSDSVEYNHVNKPATDMLYSGEQYDTPLQMQYLRARYYDQNVGGFNRLDDYAGNIHDPQSLHKYAYCHGDPINGIDPSGNSALFWTVAAIGVLVLIGVFAAIYFGGRAAMGSKVPSNLKIEPMTASIYVGHGHHVNHIRLIPGKNPNNKPDGVVALIACSADSPDLLVPGFTPIEGANVSSIRGVDFTLYAQGKEGIIEEEMFKAYIAILEHIDKNMLKDADDSVEFSYTLYSTATLSHYPPKGDVHRGNVKDLLKDAKAYLKEFQGIIENFRRNFR